MVNLAERTLAGLKNFLTQKPNLKELEDVASMVKWIEGDPKEKETLLASAIVPFLQNSGDMIACAQKFETDNGAHTLIRFWVEENGVSHARELPILFSGINFRADTRLVSENTDRGDPCACAGWAAVVICEAALKTIDSVYGLNIDEAREAIRCITYSLPTRQRTSIGQYIIEVLAELLESTEEMLDIREYIPTALDKNEIMVAFHMTGKTKSLVEVNEMLVSIYAHSPELEVQTRMELLTMDETMTLLKEEEDEKNVRAFVSHFGKLPLNIQNSPIVRKAREYLYHKQLEVRAPFMPALDLAHA